MHRETPLKLAHFHLTARKILSLYGYTDYPSTEHPESGTIMNAVCAAPIVIYVTAITAKLTLLFRMVRPALNGWQPIDEGRLKSYLCRTTGRTDYSH